MPDAGAHVINVVSGALLNGELRDLAARVRPPVEDPLRGSPPTPSPAGPTPPGGPHGGHNSSSGPLIPCDLCTMRFNSIGGLHKHQRVVHGLIGPKFLVSTSRI